VLDVPMLEGNTTLYELLGAWPGVVSLLVILFCAWKPRATLKTAPANS
jgi:hypothetical protein